jgi:hypothetical protein
MRAQGILLAFLMTTGCGGGQSRPTPGGPGQTGGAPPSATGGVSGTGGTAGTGGISGTGGTAGTGGTPSNDAAPLAGDAAAPPSDGAASSSDANFGPAPDPSAYGGVGQTPFVPLQYTASPVAPIIAPECPEDPTAGFTEYKGSFSVQRPYDLAASARFEYKDGIYTFWVNSTDKAHAPGNTTAPRTEARYENFSTGEHLWSADVMFESPSRTCVMQIHNVDSDIAAYFRVVGDRMFNLSTGQTILTGQTGKWFNLKVALNTQTHEVRTYVNNCLKATSQSPNGGTPNWYFKNGVYTCDAGTCRSHYKNVHLYQR